MGAVGETRRPSALPRPWAAHLGSTNPHVGGAGCRTTRQRAPSLGANRSTQQPSGTDGMTLPRTGMVLAAGLATRMRPLTDQTAKPLLKLGGRTLLDHALDHLVAEGVSTVVVNAFWQADKIVSHFARRASPPDTIALQEAEPLETGGGVLNALPYLGQDPFFVINGDAFWLNGPSTALSRMASVFDDDVDVVLLVHRTFQVHAETGFGDFALDQLGVPRRRREREIVPYLFAGASL